MQMGMKKKLDLVSGWFHMCSSVPSCYVQPPECQPGYDELLASASTKEIPIIDLGKPHDDTLSLILKASQEYGFFQVINHGVSEELMEEALNMFTEFHGMSTKEKMAQISKSPNNNIICKLFSGKEVYEEGELQYWKDTLTHPCPLSGENAQFWPQKPPTYREIARKYTKEVGVLGMKILKMIAEGLGLREDYFLGELSENHSILAHHYPPCPQPNLTLGAPKHKDRTLLTILLQPQGINALQVFQHGEWIPVVPIPNAFVVNIGHILQIASNGRLVAAEHRVLTNAKKARTTVAYFINPEEKCVIQPEISLTSSTNPPLYKPISYSEFLKSFLAKGTPSVEADLLN